jgi:hypothetical protein
MRKLMDLNTSGLLDTETAGPTRLAAYFTGL